MEIKTEEDYNRIAGKIYTLMNRLTQEDNQELVEELNKLVEAAERYEEAHFPVPEPDPEEAHKFRVEQELERCWFCGGVMEVLETGIRCSSCGIWIDYGDLDTTVEYWNHPVRVDTLRTVVRKAHAELKKLMPYMDVEDTLYIGFLEDLINDN